VASNPRDDQHDAVFLAQAQQRLSQEHQVFLRRMERDKALFRLQLCCGWVLLALLPVISAVSVVIMVNYRTVPGSMLIAASAAFFGDILGLLIAAYKILVPKKVEDERASAVTAMPTLLPGERLEE
jgi:cytochrome bd-type quinol oxidase subunit 2